MQATTRARAVPAAEGHASMALLPHACRVHPLSRITTGALTHVRPPRQVFLCSLLTNSTTSSRTQCSHTRSLRRCVHAPCPLTLHWPAEDDNPVEPVADARVAYGADASREGTVAARPRRGAHGSHAGRVVRFIDFGSFHMDRFVFP